MSGVTRLTTCQITLRLGHAYRVVATDLLVVGLVRASGVLLDLPGQLEADAETVPLRHVGYVEQDFGQFFAGVGKILAPSAEGFADLDGEKPEFEGPVSGVEPLEVLVLPAEFLGGPVLQDSSGGGTPNTPLADYSGQLSRGLPQCSEGGCAVTVAVCCEPSRADDDPVRSGRRPWFLRVASPPGADDDKRALIVLMLEKMLRALQG